MPAQTRRPAIRQNSCLLCNTAFSYSACGRPQKFCSARCQTRHRRGSGVAPQPICQHCGSRFERTQRRGRLQVFCTPKCQRRHMNGWSVKRPVAQSTSRRVAKPLPPIAALPKRLPTRFAFLQEDYEQELTLARLTGVRFSVRQFIQRNSPRQEFGSDLLELLNEA